MQHLSSKKIVAGQKPQQLVTTKALSGRGSRSLLPQEHQTIGNHGLLRHRAGVIQAKLKIGAPNDKYEQEADRVADKVMRMPDPMLQRQDEEDEEKKDQLQMKPVSEKISPLELRSSEEKDDEEEIAQAKSVASQSSHVALDLEAQIAALRSGGHPLSGSTLKFFETRFGRSFAGVRVHRGARAARIASMVNARAVTIRNDIIWGAREGMYAEKTFSGQRLLAHELVHTIQQSQMRSSGTRINAPLQNHQNRFNSLSVSYASENTLQRQKLPDFSRLKEPLYKLLIKQARGVKDVFFNKLRMQLYTLPKWLQSFAKELIDATVFVYDFIVYSSLAGIGLAVGVIKFLYSIAKTLTQLILAVLKAILQLSYLLATGQLPIWLLERLQENPEFARRLQRDPGDALRWLQHEGRQNLIRAAQGMVKAIKMHLLIWFTKLKKADPERAALMIGELTGEIVALIASLRMVRGRGVKEPIKTKTPKPKSGPAKGIQRPLEEALSSPVSEKATRRLSSSARKGAYRALTYNELRLLIRRFFRKSGFRREQYKVHKTIEEFDDAFRKQPGGDPLDPTPFGFMDTKNVIHLPPKAELNTIFHEALHWVGAQSNARAKIGAFLEEGIVQRLANKTVGPLSAGSPYAENIKFVELLISKIGENKLLLAFFDGKWDQLRRALEIYFQSAEKTERFYQLILKIGDQAQKSYNLRRARTLLTGKSTQSSQLRRLHGARETRRGSTRN